MNTDGFRKTCELALIRQKLSSFSSERGGRDRKPWASERTVCPKARRTKYHPEGNAGWPSRHCSIAHGCRGRRPRPLQNNVGLGLAIKRGEGSHT